MEGAPTPGSRGPGPPPDSDLVGLPLVIGLVVAVAAIGAAFWLLGGGAGLAVLIVVLVLALLISYRVVSSSDVED